MLSYLPLAHSFDRILEELALQGVAGLLALVGLLAAHLRYTQHIHE